MRVLPPGGPPQRVSSGPFPGAEPHIFCKAKPVKLKKVAVSHFFDTLFAYAPLVQHYALGAVKAAVAGKQVACCAGKGKEGKRRAAEKLD